MSGIIGNGSKLFTVANSVEKQPVIVTNNSPAISKTSVVVTFTFPPGIKAALIQTNTPTQGTFDPVTGIWTVGTMLPATSESFDLETEIVDSTLRPFQVDYTVDTDQSPDQNPENDEAFRSFDSDFSCEDFETCTFFVEDHGAVLYVATSGDNLTALRGSEHKTFRDPWAAIAQALDGDNIYVYPGVYILGDIGSGADHEFDGTTDSMNLIPPGLTKIGFHFENQAIIRSTVAGLGTPEPAILFHDRNNPVDISISGSLQFESQERGVKFSEIENTGSKFFCELNSVTYSTLSNDASTANGTVFGLQAGIFTSIKTSVISGNITRVATIRPSSPMYTCGIQIGQIKVNEQLANTQSRSLFVIDGTGVTNSGTVVIDIYDVDININNANNPPGRGANQLLGFTNSTSYSGLQFDFNCRNYQDNIVITDQTPTGLTGTAPIIEFGGLATDVLDSQILVKMDNVITGSNFSDMSSPINSMINSQIVFELGNVQMTSIGNFLRFGTFHRMVTFTNSQVLVKCSHAIRNVVAPSVLVPLIVFNGGSTLANRSQAKCVISGNFTTSNTGTPVVHMNNLGIDKTYLFKDCIFKVATPNEPAIITTNPVEVLIHSCGTNSMTPHGSVTERIQPITRDELYI